jgi:Periplasmic sensor domain
MMTLSNIPIARKLRIISLLSATVALGLAALLHIGMEIRSFRQGRAEQLGTLTSAIGMNATIAIRNADKAMAKDLLAPLESDPDVRFASVRDAGSTQLASFTREGFSEFDARATIAQLAEERTGSDSPLLPVAVWNGTALLLRTPVIVAGGLVGQIYVQSSRSMPRRR